MRILVCDDHPIVRRGLREILEQAGAPVTVGEAASAAEGLALARKQSWDTVVLDITMPGRSGLELLKELKSERPNVPVQLPLINSDTSASAPSHAPMTPILPTNLTIRIRLVLRP